MTTTESNTKRTINVRSFDQAPRINARDFDGSALRLWRKGISGFQKYFSVAVIFALIVVNAGCFSSEQGETFYGRVAVRPKQELRWSDGGLPRIFDPALAAAAPDTDVVRALFEGLTEYDARTLATKPAAAERWESSEDNLVWTFHLRVNARWSNGDPLVAADFVRAWERAVRLGERVPHRALLANLQPTDTEIATSVSSAVEGKDEKETVQSETVEAAAKKESLANGEFERDARLNQQSPSHLPQAKTKVEALKGNQKEFAFGAEALSAFVLRVRLNRPDPNFPTLVAHTLFRPLHADNLSAEVPVVAPSVSTSILNKAQRGIEGAISETPDIDQTLAGGVDPGILTTHAPQRFVNPQLSNGAFHLANRSSSEVLLTRAATYWNRDAVKLEAVRFMPMTNLETTLAQYRAGEIDVISNAPFEPLTIKLLAPHEDFRRTTFGALNFYVFNRRIAPFDDRRVREAFTLAVDRGRLARDVLGGATEPAQEFLPAAARNLGNSGNNKNVPDALPTDQQRARQLLVDAGYKQGIGFPIVRLLVNRSASHRLVAQAVAGMWQDTLGVKTEIIVKDWRDYEAALVSGEYTIARRSLVMQTPDEKRNLEAMFDETFRELAPSEAANQEEAIPNASPEATDSSIMNENFVVNAQPVASPTVPPSSTSNTLPFSQARVAPPIVSHKQAMRDLPGIPLYFASSFALVKPYVFDFEQNLLDAPSLTSVRIDQDWKPNSESKRTTIDTP